jgi:hypothetical protein
MTKTLELAVAKASALKAAIDEGLAELDAGLGTPLDIEGDYPRSPR